MKSLIFFIVLGFTINARASHWECKGAHNLEKVSFDLMISVENFSVEAPALEQKDLQKSFEQVNGYTIVAQVLDNSVQEAIDYTLIIDRSAKTVTVFSQWSTNDNVDSEILACKVTK